MESAPQIWKRFWRRDDGAVTVSSSILLGIFIIFIGAAIEVGYAIWQYNAAQHAARMGVRIAATTDPVATSLTTMTGLSNTVEAGDPMPDYTFTCSSTSCSSGGMNKDAFDRILYGRDNDGTCATNAPERRGMCDLLSKIQPQNLTIAYEDSGFGIAGNPADIIPLVTVKLSGLSFNFLFLDIITGDLLTTMPDISVTAMSEDLKTGT